MFFVEEEQSYPDEFLKLCDKTAIYPSQRGKKIKARRVLEFGKQLTMDIAASSPLSIDKETLDENLLKKEGDKEKIDKSPKNNKKNDQEKLY